MSEGIGNVRLRLVYCFQLRYLQRVGGAENVEVGFVGNDVVVKGTLSGLLNSGTEFALSWVVEAGLQVSGSSDDYFQRAVHMEGVIKHVVVVANRSDGAHDKPCSLDSAEFAEAIVV